MSNNYLRACSYVVDNNWIVYFGTLFDSIGSYSKNKVNKE